MTHNKRGPSHGPHSVAAGKEDARLVSRVLAVKIEIDWRRAEDKRLYERLRTLGWMAAHYRNQMIRAKWAQALGYRVDAASEDKNSVSKAIRATEKGELSGDAYSCAEQEVQGAWARDGKKMLAGQPLSEWRPDAALSVSGKEKLADSGIRLLSENGQYILLLRAQSKDSPGGDCWLRLPVVRHTKRDEWQAPILDRMVTWEIPIKKATVHVEPHAIIVRLTYRLALPALPPMGERVATLGPVDADGRLHLRTETQTKDYSSKLERIRDMKDRWDLVRRRAKCQIGRRKGAARIKRVLIARLGLPDWTRTFIHTWTREAVDWCVSQGVGTIRIQSINTGGWPAHQFVQCLRYKAEESGITVLDAADLSEPGGDRAVTALIGKHQRKSKRRHEALQTLKHLVKEKTA